MSRIELVPGAALSLVPRCRKPLRLEEETEIKVDELVKKGKLQGSTSAFGQNPRLVRKKEGRWSACVNFKPLNKITVKQKLPMPGFEELLDRLQGSTIRKAFVFAYVFVQTPTHSEGGHKTTSRTRICELENTCMPFGLVGAPAELQRHVNPNFSRPVNGGWMLIYIDDLLASVRLHRKTLQHLKKALQLLREKQQYVKAPKCSCLMQTISFLGFHIFRSCG